MGAGAHDGRGRLVLIVDDDRQIRSMLQTYLVENGFSCIAAENAQAARQQLLRRAPDLVLLDLMLPDATGLDLIRDIRRDAPDAGIIMLSGRQEAVDKIVGLEMGVDDYVSKPFHLREVLARIRSLLRRLSCNVQPTAGAERKGIRYGFDGWELDIERRVLLDPAGETVSLTTAEFELLRVFLLNAGRVLDRNRLMDLTRGKAWEAYDRSIDAQVSRLRRRLSDDAAQPRIIKSVRSVGYVMAVSVAHLPD